MGKGCEDRKGKIAGYGNLVLSWLKIYLPWLKKNGSLVYTAFVIKLRVSKESKACQIFFVHLFWFCYFRRFRHSERGINSLRLEVTFIKIMNWYALIPVLLTDWSFSAFAWTDLSDLDDLLDWAFVKYGHTVTDGSGQWRQCGRHHKLCGSVLRKGASGNAFLPKEKFRAPVSRQVKTLKGWKETVRWVDLSLRVQENSKEVWVSMTSLSLY